MCLNFDSINTVVSNSFQLSIICGPECDACVTMYRLRCQIFGHSDDVRSVTSGPTFIATASRDKTAVVWRSSDEEATRFEIAVTFSGHTGFVSTICFIPSSEDHPRGLLATGCMDKLIRIYDPQMQGLYLCCTCFIVTKLIRM